MRLAKPVAPIAAPDWTDERRANEDRAYDERVAKIRRAFADARARLGIEASSCKPSAGVLEVARQCGEKGVKGLVVISAGFKETGPEGAERECQLQQLVREYGMRMIGPNCMGVFSTHPQVQLNATFAPTMPIPGDIAFMSQSGAMGVAILNATSRLNIGFSYFASVGNKADVSGNDLLTYWENDERTRVICLYLESFGNPRRFTRLAKRISRHKPILAVKSGRTAAGARAATSHTGALAGGEQAVDALLRQCGVIRAESIEDMLDLMTAFSRCRPPRGNRVAVLTNAGGPGIMTTDSLLSMGMRLATLAPETQDDLRGFLPREASVQNPVDMIASATANDYRRALEILLTDPNVDLAIVVFVPPHMIVPDDVAEAILEVMGHHSKPVLNVFMAKEEFYEHFPRQHPESPPIFGLTVEIFFSSNSIRPTVRMTFSMFRTSTRPNRTPLICWRSGASAAWLRWRLACCAAELDRMAEGEARFLSWSSSRGPLFLRNPLQPLPIEFSERNRQRRLAGPAHARGGRLQS